MAERETNLIELSNGQKVKVVTFLTWGEKEKISSALVTGAKIGNGGLSGYDMGAISESKYVALGLCVKGIVSAEGTELPFSKEWMDELKVEDGDLVFDAVDALSKKKA